MDVAECPRRLRHHCKALDLAIRIAPRPAPQTGKADRFAISRRDIEFGLGLALPFPFEPAIGGDEAAQTTERSAKRSSRLHGLGTIGRAHVLTPVTNAQLVCSIPLDNTKHEQ